MRTRRTHRSSMVFVLEGGTEDNDLWVEPRDDGEGYCVLSSTWVPTDEERQRIAAGENIELLVWSKAHPPVSVGLTDVPLGKPPSVEPGDEGRP